MKRTFKIISFYVVALIASLTIMFGITAAIYLFLNVSGLSQLGNMPGFMIGLALVETGSCVLAVGSIADYVMYGEEEEDEGPDPQEVFREL